MKSKGQTLFLKEEIEQLAKALLDISNFQKHYRIKYPIANKIQFPKVPSALSERIVLDLIQEGLILKERNIVESKLGGSKLSDIVAVTREMQTLKVEVKGTGSSEFQNFTKKDVEADYLIWIHFGNFFYTNEQQAVRVYILETPRLHYPIREARILLSLKQFLINPVSEYSFVFEQLYTIEDSLVNPR